MLVETSLGKVFCNIGGTGPTVVMIHGFACSGVQWTYTAPALQRAGFTTIAVDLPGFGNSDLPPEPITSSRYGDIIAEVLRVLDIGPVVLMGNSMGAYAAWLCAAKHPELAKSLILSNSAGAPMQGSLPARNKRRHRALGATIFPGLGAIAGLRISNPLTRRIVRPIIDKCFGDPTRVTPEVFELLHQAAKRSRIVLTNRLTWGQDVERESLLASISCPTLIIWGDKDAIVPISSMDFFVDHIHHAKLKVYFGVGHLPMLEIPDEFNRDVIAFLTTVGDEWIA